MNDEVREEGLRLNALGIHAAVMKDPRTERNIRRAYRAREKTGISNFVPAKPGKKHPPFEWKRWMVFGMTEADIRREFVRAGGAVTDMFVPLGDVAGYVVLDIDDATALEYADDVLGLGDALQITALVKTLRGWHYWFKTPRFGIGSWNGRTRLDGEPALELKANRTGVVWPNGRERRVVRPLREAILLPESLILRERVGLPGDAVAIGTETPTRFRDPEPEGDWNRKVLYTIGCICVEDITPAVEGYRDDLLVGKAFKLGTLVATAAQYQEAVEQLYDACWQNGLVADLSEDGADGEAIVLAKIRRQLNAGVARKLAEQAAVTV